MKIPRHKIAELLIGRTLKPGVDSKTLSKEVAAFLLETGRSGELASLSRDIMQKRAEKGVVEITAVSAHALSTQLRKEIKDKIRDFYPGAKKIIINEITDANMIGGVRLELANQQLDLTVRSRLNRFKQLTTSGKD
ncbi:MAG TPA: F0F1 ATP synthase subunit delta [Candidatus Saccharimonadales bacterium]|nr:F0F1 ATP synthase subunit delta [Candidatus Saccharimonadales bacterium]